MIKTVILCAVGMSSSVVVKAVRRAAENKGVEVDIHCQPGLTYRDMDYSVVDVVLLAPQLGGQAPEILDYFAANDIKVPVEKINQLDYALAKGENVLNRIVYLYEEAHKPEENN